MEDTSRLLKLHIVSALFVGIALFLGMQTWLSEFINSQQYFAYAASPDGRYLARTGDGSLQLADLTTGKTRQLDTNITLDQISFSPDSRKLAVVDYHMNSKKWNGFEGLMLYDLETGTKSFGPRADDALWLPGTSQLFIYNTVYNNALETTHPEFSQIYIRLYDADSHSTITNRLLGHTSGSGNVYGSPSISPDGKAVALQVKYWGTNTHSQTNFIIALPELTQTHAWTNTHDIIMISSNEAITTTGSLVERYTFNHHPGSAPSISSLAGKLGLGNMQYDLSPSGERLVEYDAHTYPKTVRIVNLDTWEDTTVIPITDKPGSSISMVAWIENDSTLLYVSNYSAIQKIDTETQAVTELAYPWTPTIQGRLGWMLGLIALYLAFSFRLTQRSRRSVDHNPSPTIDLAWRYLFFPAAMALALIPILQDDTMASTQLCVLALNCSISITLFILGVQLYLSRLLTNPLTYWLIATSCAGLTTLPFIWHDL